MAWNRREAIKTAPTPDCKADRHACILARPILAILAVE